MCRRIDIRTHIRPAVIHLNSNPNPNLDLGLDLLNPGLMYAEGLLWTVYIFPDFGVECS